MRKDYASVNPRDLPIRRPAVPGWMGWDRIEPGILPVVKLLIRMRAVPVWSCEGGHGWHPSSPNRWWFNRTIWPLVRGKPFVICVGGRWSRGSRAGAVTTCLRLLEDGYGPLRLLYLHIVPGRWGDNLLRRVRWTRAKWYYAIVFADRRATMPLRQQERAASRGRRRNRR